MLPERFRGPVLAAMAGAVVLACYVFFTWRSLALYFDQDDMMNLYLAWSQPLGDLLRSNVLYWTDPLRPLGALFYRVVFAVAGFTPLPFRAACLVLGLVNLGLCCRFVKLVSGSNSVVAFAAILFAFQTRLMEVWFRTAVIYDLVCFTFFYAAACLYVSARQKGAHPGVGRVVAIVACFVAAMDAKEVAIALPAILIVWELLFAKFRWRNLALPALLGMLAIPYVMAKTIGPKALTGNPYYQPEYTLPRFTETWGTFLGFLFVQPNPVSGMVVALLLGVPLAIALALRSKKLLFAWALLVISTAPMSFLPYRGGFVLYISYVGWVLFAGLLLEPLTALAGPRWRTAAAVGVFLLLGWRVGKINLHDQRADTREWLYDPPRMIRALTEEMKALQPRFAKSARILLTEDAFGTDEWTPVFTLRLAYKDVTLVVDRVKMMNLKPVTWDGYQFVFTYENGRYRQLKP